MSQLEFALTDIEQERLVICEKVIERGLQTFVEVGEALLTIRDARLYRAGHSTFEDYCWERWGWKRNYANKLIVAAEVTGSVAELGTAVPTSERQARELAPLRESPAVMRDAWQEAVESSNGKPTAGRVREVVQGYRQSVPLPSEPVGEDDDADQGPIPGAPPALAAPIDPWTDEERDIRGLLESGETVVISFRHHQRLIDWATRGGLFVRIDRQSRWGNPFEIPGDGDRETVIASYRDHYLPHKPSLLTRLPELRGKALGCWCAPDPCHGDVLSDEANRDL